MGVLFVVSSSSFGRDDKPYKAHLKWVHFGWNYVIYNRGGCFRSCLLAAQTWLHCPPSIFYQKKKVNNRQIWQWNDQPSLHYKNIPSLENFSLLYNGRSLSSHGYLVYGLCVLVLAGSWHLDGRVGLNTFTWSCSQRCLGYSQFAVSLPSNR